MPSSITLTDFDFSVTKTEDYEEGGYEDGDGEEYDESEYLHSEAEAMACSLGDQLLAGIANAQAEFGLRPQLQVRRQPLLQNPRRLQRYLLKHPPGRSKMLHCSP